MNELKERLLRHIEIDENNCWIWQGAVRRDYGAIWHDGKTRYTHRVAYELFVGEIPTGLVLDHLCRTKLCCNKDHLEPIKQSENVHRGKLPKLDWNKVRKIRKLYAEGGFTQRELARMFGVSQRLISLIVRNEVWIEEVAA